MRFDKYPVKIIGKHIIKKRKNEENYAFPYFLNKKIPTMMIPRLNRDKIIKSNQIFISLKAVPLKGRVKASEA